MDGGQTWSPVVGQPAGVMPHHGKLASTGFLYLSYNNNAGPYDGSAGNVWKYDTGSAAWTDITPPPSPLNGGYGFGGLSVDGSNPNTIVVGHAQPMVARRTIFPQFGWRKYLEHDLERKLCEPLAEYHGSQLRTQLCVGQRCVAHVRRDTRNLH